jgi:Tfp pilus assembly protein PilX
MTRYAERPHPRARDRGAATLFLVTLLLMSAGLLAWHAARVGLTGQRLSANDVLAHEALSAAQGGLESAFADIARLDPAAAVFDSDGLFVIDGPEATLANGARFTTRLHNHGLTPWDTTLLRVESEGISSDGIGRRIVQQLARLDPWLAHAPPATLVAHDDIALSDDAMLRNRFRPYAVWSGGGFVAPDPVLIDVVGTAPCPLAGVCDDDDRLAGLSADAFFSNFFGHPADTVQAGSVVITCATCDAGDLPAGEWPLWLGGDAGFVEIAGGSIGSLAAPVLLVIDGNLLVGADTTIHGLVYVRGDWLPGAGGLSVQGAMIIAGAVREPGILALEYDPAILDLLAARGPYARIAGSWTDF